VSQQLTTVTYVEIHAKVVDTCDECVLGEIGDLVVKDLLLQRVLFLDLQPGRRRDHFSA